MTGLYTGTMGIISNMTKLNVHSNNVANSSTNGYKFEQESFRVFEETYMRSKKNDSNERIGKFNHEVYVDNIRTNFMPGTHFSTDSSLDFSLNDKNHKEYTSFFIVGKGEETYLTRNGRFILDANRQISTANGGQLLDTAGNAIVVPEGVNVSVRSDGSIIRTDTNQEIAQMQLRTVKSEDLGMLKKEHGGYYSVWTVADIEKNFGPIQTIINEFDQNTTLQKVFGTKSRLEQIRDGREVAITNEFSTFDSEVRPYSLETSNVDMSKEMVGIMSAQKGVQFGQKVFNSMDKVLEKEANDIAK